MDIVVTCDSSLFILTERGHIRYQRRLDYTPSCIKTYHLKTSGSDIFEDDNRSMGQVMTDARETGFLDTPCFMSMIGTFNNFLMIYKDVKLVWAAKTVNAPIFIDTAKFEDQVGLIVTMSDSGFLQVSYLGTEQLTAATHALTLKDTTKINYEQVNADHS
jgi:hypothetical protein